ncbi:MAG: hypothetical protein RLZZ335_1014 [Bacteroidota bacterium]|jgi:1-acyl-sn-glycerol-3-phosphate acyltransferase
MGFFRDSFGHWYLAKRLLYMVVGAYGYIGLNIRNRMVIRGSRHLSGLPEQNVLFVSNHQTYFRDVMAMLHVMCAVRWRMFDYLGFPIYLLTPRSRVYFVAAEETMKRGGLLPKLFALGGAITVTRTWRSEGKEVSRKVVKTDIDNINRALKEGWVITFPQGTTAAFAPGRKGTAHIIKQNRPVVVPVVIDGFRRAFDKKGLLLKKKGVRLKMTFKPPLELDYEASNEEILDRVMDAIEQSDRHRFQHYRKTGSDET